MNQQPAAESDATEPQAEGRAQYTVIPPAGGEPGQGKVVFVGAGPGAADLITVRGAPTIAAADIIIWASSLVNAEIVADHGPVLFHQSGGCCDGSSPMCYPQGDFRIGARDVLLGQIGGAPFYISASQYETWKHTDLIIDVVAGRGGMFSLDNGREKRFLTRSELCAVPPQPAGE